MEESARRAATTTARRRRFSRSSRRLALFFRAMAIAIPSSVLFVAARASAADLARGIGVPAPDSVAIGVRVAVVALALVPALAIALSLEALRRCALSIHEGRGLTLDVARCLRHAAFWMFASSAAALIVPTLAGMLLSAANGKLSVTVQLGAGVALPIILAGALRLLSGVVVDAAALADEHAQIV